MTTKKARAYRWYIEPLDSDTNAALARELPDEDTLEITDAGGVRRKTYLIPSRELSKFRRSKNQQGFHFNALSQEGDGKIRLANFLPAIRRKKRVQLAMSKRG